MTIIKINGVDIDTEKYVKKWTDLALEATPATDEEVTKNVQRLYELAGLDKPEVKVYREYEEFMSIDWESVGESVGVIVGKSFGASVGVSVGESVGMSVGESVGKSFGESVGVSVGESVGMSVGESVGKSFGESVGVSVWVSFGESVGKSFGESVGVSVEAGLWYWADNLAYADVFVDAGVLSEEKARELEEYRRILSTQRLAIMTRDTAYVLVAPVVRRNEAGRLHSTDTYAVQWGNSGIYYLNGVEIPPDLFKKIPTMSMADVLKIENTEQRRVIYEITDKMKMKELADYKVLDEVENDGKGYPMKVIEFTVDGFDNPFRYLNVFCPTTGREYFIETQEVDCWKAKRAGWGLDNVEFVEEW